MSFNKRFINRNNLEVAASNGLNNLIKWVTSPDALIIEQGISKEVCDIIQKSKTNSEIKLKLKEIGFYEFE